MTLAKIMIIMTLFKLSIVQAQDKTIVVGVENLQYLPHFSNDGKEYMGFAREILDLFAQKKGYQIKYHILPVGRLFSEFLSDNSKLDLKYPDNAYWKADKKRDKKVIYSEPVVSYTDGVMILPEHYGKGLDRLKILGTALGFTPFSYLKYIQSKQVKISENSSFINLLKQTLLGRVHGAYINISVAQHQLREHLKRPGDLVFDKTLPHSTDNYHVSTINRPDLIEAFNQFLEENRGTVQAMKAKHQVSAVIP